MGDLRGKGCAQAGRWMHASGASVSGKRMRGSGASIEEDGRKRAIYGGKDAGKRSDGCAQAEHPCLRRMGASGASIAGGGRMAFQ